METTINFTEKELEFLNKMRQSDFYEGDFLNCVIWDYSVNDFLSYKGKIRSGVISSLTQKGIISVYKKEKGDIAGTYALTEYAISNPIIQAIFND